MWRKQCTLNRYVDKTSRENTFEIKSKSSQFDCMYNGRLCSHMFTSCCGLGLLYFCSGVIHLFKSVFRWSCLTLNPPFLKNETLPVTVYIAFMIFTLSFMITGLFSLKQAFCFYEKIKMACCAVSVKSQVGSYWEKLVSWERPVCL